MRLLHSRSPPPSPTEAPPSVCLLPSQRGRAAVLVPAGTFWSGRIQPRAASCGGLSAAHRSSERRRSADHAETCGASLRDGRIRGGNTEKRRLLHPKVCRHDSSRMDERGGKVPLETAAMMGTLPDIKATDTSCRQLVRRDQTGHTGGKNLPKCRFPAELEAPRIQTDLRDFPAQRR